MVGHGRRPFNKNLIIERDKIFIYFVEMILLSTEDSSIVCASKTQFNDKYIIEIMLLSTEDSSTVCASQMQFNDNHVIKPVLYCLKSPVVKIADGIIYQNTI